MSSSNAQKKTAAFIHIWMKCIKWHKNKIILYYMYRVEHAFAQADSKMLMSKLKYDCQMHSSKGFKTIPRW